MGEWNDYWIPVDNTLGHVKMAPFYDILLSAIPPRIAISLTECYVCGI